MHHRGIAVVLFAVAAITSIPARAEPVAGRTPGARATHSARSDDVRRIRATPEVDPAALSVNAQFALLPPDVIGKSYTATVTIENAPRPALGRVVFDPRSPTLFDRAAMNAKLGAGPVAPLRLLRGLPLPGSGEHPILVRPTIDGNSMGMLASGHF
jgi:hypothetical protein